MMVPASGLSPEIMMKQCEEITAKLKKLAMQHNETHEQCGLSASGQGDGCSRTVARVDGAAWTNRSLPSSMKHLGNKFSEVSNEEIHAGRGDRQPRIGRKCP